MTAFFDRYPPPARAVVISPHTDDALFSIGTYLSCLTYTTVTIASPMAGIPTDSEGLNKHVKLRQEHENAVRKMLGPEAMVANGDFLDDVYEPRPTDEELCYWITEQIKDANFVYVPLGIHHPDHVQVSDATLKALRGLRFRTGRPRIKAYAYAELPYRLDYPGEYKARVRELKVGNLSLWRAHKTAHKREALLEYVSQIDEDLMVKLLEYEYVWHLS